MAKLSQACWKDISANNQPIKFKTKEIPIYKEITFFDLNGNEKYKISSINEEKLNISNKKNTYVSSESYFDEISKLKKDEIYVSDVIGEYVGSKIIGIFTKEKAQELGKLETLSDEDKEKSYETVGLGALKYFMLKVDPKKKMMFNPAESIDFAGNTGPFIQYTYARIQSLLAKADYQKTTVSDYELNVSEKELVMNLSNFKEVISRAAETLSPALVANYVYEVVKSYNSFYQNNPILNQDNENAKNFRLELSELTGKTIKKGLELLGIGTVNRM